MNKIIIEDLNRVIAQPIPWKKFKNKTVLISGAGGFIPSFLVKVLIHLNEKKKLNIRIIALVRSKERALNRLHECKNNKYLSLVVHDVTKLYKTKIPIHFIIHAASTASPKYFLKDPVGMINANMLGTQNLLKLAQIKKVESFLFFSTGEIYGQIKNYLPLSESSSFGYIDPADVRSSYAESKRMGESICVAWFHQHNVPVKIVRPFHTYGPGLDPLDGRVFADFVTNIVKSENIVLKSSGSASRSFCYLSDATNAFFTVLLKGKNGEAYNVANSNSEIKIKKLAHILTQLFPEKKLKVVFQARLKSDSYLVSPISHNMPDTKKIELLGWKPYYQIKEGFKRTVLSFLN